MSTQAVAQPPVVAKRNGAGTAALVSGVVALVLAASIIFFPIAAILGLVAAVLGFLGLGRANRAEADNRSHAMAGLVTGALAFFAAVVIALRIGTFIADHDQDFRAFWRCITSAPTETEQNDCGAELARRLD